MYSCKLLILLFRYFFFLGREIRQKYKRHNFVCTAMKMPYRSNLIQIRDVVITNYKFKYVYFYINVADYSGYSKG